MISIQSLKLKYQKMPAGIKASVWFVFCSVLQKGISFLTVPVFTRILTTDQYGQLSLYQSWLGIISIFATLNLYSGVFNNGMIKYDSDREKYTSTMQGLSTVTTLVVFFVYLLQPKWWQNLFGLPPIVVFSMFLEILLIPAFNYWSMRQRFEYRYKALVGITIASALLNPIIGFVAVSVSNDKGVARVLSASILNIALGLIFYILNFWRGKTFYRSEYWWFALKFNLPLIPHYLSQIILSQSDRIMIEKYKGNTAVAIYSLAYTVGMIMGVVTQSVNSSFVPWTYKCCKNKEFSKIKKFSNILVLFISIFALIPTIVAPEIVSILGPKSYYEASVMIPPIAIAAYLIFVYSLFGNIEFYFEESKFVMIASCVAAIANIILNVIMIPIFGYIVAAYTTVICYFFLCLSHYYFMKAVLRKNLISVMVYDVKLISLITLILIVMSALMMILYPYPVIRYSIMGLICFSGVIKHKSIFAAFNRLKNTVQSVD